MKIHLTIIIFVVGANLFQLSAQDPFFIHFYNNKSYYNPALTGSRGALSVDLKYKDQWRTDHIAPFQTAAISVEESVPCGWFDFGAHYFGDREGDGMLETHQLGGSFVGTAPFSKVWNFRMGGSMLWSQKRIDFSKLIFSDQLDPKYGTFDSFGNPNQSSFVPPDNNGRSLSYLTPSVGIVLRYAADVKNYRSRKAYLNSLTLGGSYHNILTLGGNEDRGHISSLLDLRYQTPERITFFVEPEWAMPFSRSGQYVSITPLFLTQFQQELNYLEMGSKLSYMNSLSLGCYFHLNSPSDQGANTSWFNFLVEFGKTFEGANNYHRVDFGFSFATNFTGLQNVVGPILEFSMSYQIGKSNVCNWMGREDEVLYKKGPKCPVSGRGKIYDNIW
jgi:type IX secretion system PorP/SprF family membrane protein